MKQQNSIVVDPRDFASALALLRYIKQLKDTHVIIAQPQEFAPVVEEIWENARFRQFIKRLVDRNNLHVEYWLGTFESNRYLLLEDAGISVESWPLYWAYRTKDNIMFDTYDPAAQKDKLFVSLNNRGHPHRCMLIDRIFQRGLDQCGYITWNDLEDSASDYKFKYFHGDQMQLTEPDNPDDHTPYHQYLPPLEYSSAAFALISETTLEHKDISEKTFTAIFYRKPFIIQGHPGIHQLLTNYGFELYDEYIDYSFDQEKDHSKRTDMILAQLERHRTADYNQIACDLTQKAQRNYRRLEQIATSAEHVPDKLSEYMPDISCVVPQYMVENPKKFGL